MESYEIIWENVKNSLINEISTIHFELIINKLVPIDLDQTRLVLMAKPETYYKVTDRIKQKIKDALIKLDMGITDVEIFSGENKEEYEHEKITRPIIPEIESSPIDPKYTFDNFVVGQSNNYLYAAAKAVAENPGNSYNPLFIHGASGLGKTHIMHAIANSIKKTSPQINVLYATCEKFTNDLINVIRTGKAHSVESADTFRSRYRNVDVLIIDDVQFLAKKQSTQEEFFHTFNALYGANKQIILSADCEPKDIELLDERLRTRFEGGLKAKVEAPDIETKIAILQKKAELKKQILSVSVASYIAEHSKDDVRSLEGLLNKVIFASFLKEKPITLELAIEALNEGEVRENKDVLTTQDVIDAVCDFYKISKTDLLSKKRNKEIAEPRQICAYLMTELMSIPLVTIGQALGGRDHATIIHSREKIADLIAINDKISTEINDIKNLIYKK